MEISVHQTAPRSLLSTPSSRTQMRKAFSTFMAVVVGLCTLLAVSVMVIILGYVIVRGLPALNVAFFTERPLPFGEIGGGIKPAIDGSIMMVAVAALLGLPIGIFTAIYLSEFGRGPFASVIRFLVDVLSGFPSIVIGVFIWATVVRVLVGHYAGIAGAVALAIIMIPIITRTVEEVLRLVPGNLREASLALGVPEWRTILFVVLPVARTGIITGAILAMARAGGETAPLLLTALGNQFSNFNLFDPMASLPVQIYDYAKSPYDDWHTKAWGTALILITLIGLLSVATRFLTRSRMRS